jgi:hypothetical protein
VLALAGAPADVPVLADALGSPDAPQPARSALPHRAPLTDERAARAAQADPLDLALLQRVRQGLERMGRPGPG